jgi:hypothetical protein
MLPGILTWTALLFPVVASIFAPWLVAYIIIVFATYWLFKSINMSRNLLLAYWRLRWAGAQDWRRRLELLSDPVALVKFVESQAGARPRGPAREELDQLATRLEHQDLIGDPGELIQLVMLPTYKEPYEVLETTLEAILASDYDAKRIMLVLAVDESRPNPAGVEQAGRLEERYGKHFYHFLVTRHEHAEGEIYGKGPNISYAGRKAWEWLREREIAPENVIVTSLDADHRPHPKYFANLAYIYCLTPHPETKTFQPMQVAANNIWDAPAINRITAFGTSFWLLVESVRSRRLRNYSSQAQSMRALLDSEFWSTTSIVEDGHQFWRTYFAYGGEHRVIPLYLPVYIDAVLSETYVSTIKAQYVQLRRWAWGASDVPFVITNFMRHPDIPLREKVVQTFRLIEGHFTWATASLYLTVMAWLPILLNPSFREEVLAHSLVPTASRILTLAMIGLFISIWISLLLLPPRPKHRGRAKHAGMVAQWFLLPVVTIFFSSFPAIDSQTRLMLGRYMENFDVTEKVRKSEVT